MCTEAHFEGKNLSNKTKFPLNVLGWEPQVVRNYRELQTRLSKLHSICANDHSEENQNSLETTVFYHFRNKGRKISDFRQSLLCTVGKTAFCVCRAQFWYVLWTILRSWTFLVSEQEIFGNSTQKFWLCFFQNCILRVKTIFLSKNLYLKKLFIFFVFLKFNKKKSGFSRRKFGTVVQTAFYVCKQWFFWGERNFPKVNIFCIFSGLRAENVSTFGQVFFCTVVETAFGVFSAPFWCLFEQFSHLAPFRYLSINCLELWSKTSETFVKLLSTCTDEYFEEKLVFANKVVLFYDFWTLGIIKRTNGGKRIAARLSDLTTT